MATLDPEIESAVLAVAPRLAETEATFLELLRSILANGSNPVREPRVARVLGESALRASRFEDPPDVATAKLREAGAELFRLGFDESRHQTAMKAMLKVLQEVYPLEWSSSASSTWIGFFFWVREEWMAGAVAARAADAPAATPAQY